MFKPGKKVRIKNTLNYTDNSVGVDPAMEDMMGKIYIIEEDNGNTITCRGWLFHKKDVILLDKTKQENKKIKPEYFNPNNLI